MQRASSMRTVQPLPHPSHAGWPEAGGGQCHTAPAACPLPTNPTHNPTLSLTTTTAFEPTLALLNMTQRRFSSFANPFLLSGKLGGGPASTLTSHPIFVLSLSCRERVVMSLCRGVAVVSSHHICYRLRFRFTSERDDLGYSLHLAVCHR